MVEPRPEKHFEYLFKLLAFLVSNERKEASARELILGDTMRLAMLAPANFEEMLAARQEAWRIDRNPKSIAEAIFICGISNKIPLWLAAAAFGLIHDYMWPKKKRERRELFNHFVRWAAVRELRERDELGTSGWKNRTEQDRYRAVSDILAKTDAFGDRAAVKRSCHLVDKKIAAGLGEQFLIWMEGIQEAGLSILDQPDLIVGKPRRTPKKRGRRRTPKRGRRRTPKRGRRKSR